MGRARITLKRIANARARKQAFMQRRKGLLKKVSEFCTLCEAKACLIVYGDGIGDVGVETWPQDPTMVHSILEKYESERNQKDPKTFTIEDFFENRKNMIEAEISRVQKEIINIKYPTWDPCFGNLGDEQLRAFIAMLDAKIEACDHRIKEINMLKNMHQSDQASFNVMQNIAEETVASLNLPSQLNLMKNSSQSQSQLLPPPMNPLNNGMVGFTNNQVDEPLDSTNQVNEYEDWVNELVAPNDWSNQFGGDLVSMANQPGEFMLENIPFQPQNNEQLGAAALHGLPPPPLNDLQTDYYNMLLQNGQH